MPRVPCVTAVGISPATDANDILRMSMTLQARAGYYSPVEPEKQRGSQRLPNTPNFNKRYRTGVICRSLFTSECRIRPIDLQLRSCCAPAFLVEALPCAAHLPGTCCRAKKSDEAPYAGLRISEWGPLTHPSAYNGTEGHRRAPESGLKLCLCEVWILVLSC